MLQLDFVLYYFLQFTMSSASQGGGFIEVIHGSKKRKASNSPTLPSQALLSPLETSVLLKSYRKNTISVIISGVDEKFKSWRKITSKLRQYHPCLKMSRIKELPHTRFFSNRLLTARCNYITKRK